MSILNARVEPDRVWISTDSACAPESSGAASAVSKCCVFHHMDAAIAGRGSAFMYHLIVLGAASNARFDDLVANFRAIFDFARSIPPVPEQIAVPGGSPAILIAGWSDARKRFVAWEYTLGPDGAMVADEVRYAYSGPGVDTIDPGAAVQSEGSLLWTAAKQVEWALKERPGMPHGGKIYLTELTRGYITIRTLGDLGQAWQANAVRLDPPEQARA